MARATLSSVSPDKPRTPPYIGRHKRTRLASGLRLLHYRHNVCLTFGAQAPSCAACTLRWVAEPSRDRPEMPDGYGVPANFDHLLEWAVVLERLSESLHYWMATTRPDGRPHVVPRWGAWIEGRLWYDGALDTVHVQNLNQNAACVVSIGDGAEAILVEGRSEAAAPPGVEFAEQLAAEISTKYADRGYSPKPGSWEGEDAGGLRMFTPAKALAWFDYPTDVTRFRF